MAEPTHPALERYVGEALGRRVGLRSVEPLAKSTRDPPLRVDVEMDGEERSLVLRLGSPRGEHEFEVLRAMESVPVPTPRVYGWDPGGKALGAPCFLMDFVEGEGLLGPLRNGEAWAEELYLDSVCDLQGVTREQLAPIADRLGESDTAADVLEHARQRLPAGSDPLVDAAYAMLTATMPPLPTPLFSNGDLYPTNLIVRNRELAGVIDFETSGFSDPLFEFLLAFFVHPEFRGRGIEERYCRRMGLDPSRLPWYRGFETFDTLHWVLKLGKPFVHHTSESLREDLASWLEED